MYKFESESVADCVCSDGAGRTGTYCLIDMVLSRLNKGSNYKRSIDTHCFSDDPLPWYLTSRQTWSLARPKTKFKDLICKAKVKDFFNMNNDRPTTGNFLKDEIPSP